ncbi:MAG: type II secretion system GspH family protein [Phycisphaerae bacterium]|nr:type II secretion system GspH family protein [Phycisphaerae bacterium]
MWEKRIKFKGYIFGRKSSETRGFTLIELLVAISIVSVLMGILIPVLATARRQAGMVLCRVNQRHIVNALSLYATDNDAGYPESVATITFGSDWHWQEATMMTACKPRPSHTYRSMSAYLHSYIEDASIMFCPNAPRKYEYLQDAWDTGDDWDNPETSFPSDPVFGAYCFYYNYVGFLPDHAAPFRGPRNALGEPGQSKLLVSDYFGYDHHRSPNAYGSCEPFTGASFTPGTEVSSAYWSRLKSERVNLNTIDVKLHAGYNDGHVESFKASEVVPMKVSTTPDGSVPYPGGVGLGPGDFYLPKNGLR